MNSLTITNQTLDSREVAEMCEMGHPELLRKIDGINEDFRESKIAFSKYWAKSSYQVEGQTRRYRNFLITKRGCEFLAHKTTGTKGNLFTDRYMDKFEQMKEYVEEKQLPKDSYMISDPIERAKAWIKEQQQKELLNSQLQEKNRFINQIAISENSLLVREVAKIATKENISIGEKRLWNKLREWNLVFKNSTEPMQDGINRGLFEVVEGTRTCKGKTFTYQTTRVTGKGQAYIINKLLKE